MQLWGSILPRVGRVHELYRFPIAEKVKLDLYVRGDSLIVLSEPRGVDLCEGSGRDWSAKPADLHGVSFFTGSICSSRADDDP